MTYNYNYTTYEFTAFSIDDLRPGESRLDCGETFTMPGSATLCFEVCDNDRFLSGDSYDHATDHSGQTASIMDGDTDVGNGGQIYAESYFWVQDQDGHYYVLIEIEQEGTHEKYYTFHEAYGVPEAGDTLTAVQQCNVSGNWVDYKCLDAGDKEPTGSISGTVWCDIDCDGVSQEVEILPGCDYTIEAEDMHQSGYWSWGHYYSDFKTVHGDNASGDQLVKLACAGSDGALCTTFNGKDGVYDVKIRVQDENDGQSTIKLKVNGHFVEAIKLDADTDGHGNDNGDFSTYVIQDVNLHTGDDLTLAVWGEHGEFVRIDKIDLEGEDTTIVTEEPVKEGVTVKLIDLDGNVVAETTTDAHGNYSFDGVPVGEYKIMGVAPDGTEFTIQDAGNDDSIDSDVDANGMSGVISVTDGSNTDIDLGLKDIKEGTIKGTVWCDVDCDGIQDTETTTTKGNNLLKDGDFELGHTAYNTDGYGHWYDAGNNSGDVIQGDHEGHNGNAAHNEIFELDCGSILCQNFHVSEAGTYCLTLDVYDNHFLGAHDDSFKIKINGHTVETVTVTADGQVEIELDLAAGSNRIDLVSLSSQGGKGPGVDNIEIRQVVESTVQTEPVKEGVEIKLIDASGAVVATTLTDADGNYEFANVRAGDYTIMGVAPDGTEFTIQDAGSDDSVDSDVDGNGMSGVITVVDEGVVDVDLGLKEIKTGAIEGRYFCDDDGDSVESSGDSPIAGATVILLDAAGAEVSRTTTDADGNYSFLDVDAGDYSVVFQAPDEIAGQVGKEFVAANQGGDEATDSDVESTDGTGAGTTGTVSVVAGETTRNVDAGIADPGTSSISGRYFCDENDNDVDDGEPGIAGVTVTALDASGAVAGSAVTDADGNYTIGGLDAGDYTLVFDADPTGKAFVAQDDPDGNGDDTNDSDVDGTGTTQPVTVGVDEQVENVDAGVEDPNTAALKGRVFCDENDNDVDDGEPGVEGVTVVLLNGDGTPTGLSTTTGADGSYEFLNLPAGDYIVDFDETDADLGGKVLVAQDDPNGNGDDTNDSDASQADGQTGVITLGIGETSENVDAGVEDPNTAVISGRYFCDENDNDVDDGEPGIANAAVALLDAAGNPVLDAGGAPVITTTDADGNYAFTGLAAGTYSVLFAADATGKTFVAQDDPNGNGDDTNDSDVDANGQTGPITVAIGEVSENNDAGAEDPGTASITGTVFCDEDDSDTQTTGDTPVEGVRVVLLDAAGDPTGLETTTDAAGNYTFTGLDAGTYSVFFDESTAGGKTLVGQDVGGNDDVDSDANPGNGTTAPVTLGIGETADLDAGVEVVDPGTASIGDFVWEDTDGDGLQGASEAGIDGVEVTLTGAGADGILGTSDDTTETTTTMNGGQYLFDGLTAGDYKVTFGELDGFALTTQDATLPSFPGFPAPDSEPFDSDADPTNGMTDTVTLGIGEANLDVDAGYIPDSAEIGDKVFLDLNGDGVQANDEPGFQGVTVELLNEAGAVIATDETDAQGEYRFTGLSAGTYTVRFVVPAGFDLTLLNQGNDAFDSDADPITGETAPIILAAGESNLTIDAGIVSQGPEANDDMAMTCADENVTVDVLANDANGGALTITEVDGQAISEGGPAVDVNGVLVSLVGGQLVIDGTVEFADLKIREEAFRDIEYTVADGLGGFDTANLNVKFCGALNTLQTIADGLPSTLQFELADVTVPQFVDAYTATISGSGDARFDGLVIEEAYCVDFFDPIAPAILTTADVLLATEANAAVVGIKVPENMDLVNWLINQDFGSMDNGDGTGDTYTDLEVQEAIWDLLNGDDLYFIGNQSFAPDNGNGVYEPALGELGTNENVDEIVAMTLASAEAEGFEAGEGDLVTLLLDPFDPETQVQPFIIAVEFDALKEDCIC